MTGASRSSIDVSAPAPIEGDVAACRARWRDRTLVQLVSGPGVSVRLTNAIVTADHRGDLPFQTIGEYLDAGASATDVLLRRVANFGRKSARELVDLVAHAAEETPEGEPKAATEEAASLGRADFLALFQEERLGEVLGAEVMSARLGAALAGGPYLALPFSEILDQLAHYRSALRRTPNCGRRSVDEFSFICARHVARRLTASGVDAHGRQRAQQIFFGADGSDGQEGGEDLGAGVPDHSSLTERLDWLLEQVTERPRAVLRSRFGINQPVPETLEEIGCRYGVTRERIRQLESHGLRQLRTHARRAPIRELLDREAEGARHVLFAGEAVLLTTSLSDRRKRLDPHLHLALEIEQLNYSDWLDRLATRLPLGWCSPDLDSADVNAAALALGAGSTDLPLPIALRSLAAFHAPDAVEAACALVLGQVVHAGYLMPGRVGPRLARAVGLHRTLRTSGRTLSITDLLAGYLQRFPNDPCSQRDAEIVMDLAPQLFLEISEGQWRAVGAAGSPPPPLSAAAPLPRSTTEEPGTIAHALQTTLAGQGLTRLGDLLERAAEILPEGRSANSIGPVLLTRSDLFKRPLPGVYGLSEDVPGPDSPLPDDYPILLNDHQARLFALGRYSGEPRSAFALWSASAEYRLCQWARHSADEDLFRSLLAVSEPEAWPVSDTAREDWLALRRLKGRFTLGAALRKDKAYERPPLDRVLAACIHASDHGAIGWMACNRILGRKVDLHGGAGLLALLLKLEAVKEDAATGYRWQRPHLPMLGAGKLARSLMDELAIRGELRWDSDLGQQLIARAVGSELPGNSWVDAVAVDQMMTGTLVAAEPDEVEDDLEGILERHRRAKEIDRREAMLQRLLDE